MAAAPERGCLAVLGNSKSGCEEGKFFQFRAEDLTAIIGPWASQGGGPVHVKSGDGAVLRARNPRTGKEDGVLLWGDADGGDGPADAYGCWNPAAFCTSEDWQVGDTVELLDFCADAFVAHTSLPAEQIVVKTGTGWNLSGDHIQWGRCGIVGDWWKALEVQFDFGRSYRVVGVRTDSVDLPFSVSYLAGSGEWVQAASGLTGSAAVAPFVACQCRLRWEDTNMHQLRGLSTMRSGGGVHADFVGSEPTETNDSNESNAAGAPASNAVESTESNADEGVAASDAIDVMLSAGAQELAAEAPTGPVALGNARLARVANAAVLDALQASLETRPDWLGLGRDVEATSTTYSGLQLCAAWTINHKMEQTRYDLAKQELREHLEGTADSFPPVELRPTPWTEALGFSLDPGISEALLFHGTKINALPAILNSGLNERFSSGLFGHGSYLADDAGKADQYCTMDAIKQETKLHEALYPGDTQHPGNVYYMLVCRAALGHAAVTLDGQRKRDGDGELWATADRRELGDIPGVDPPVAHHSLVVETGKAVKRYREIVVFHSDRLVSDYLIAYRRALAPK